MKKLTQRELDEKSIVLSADELARQQEHWDKVLDSQGLPDIEKRYTYADDTSTVYIQGQRIQGQRILSLDLMGESGIEVPTEDVYFQDEVSLDTLKRNWDILLAFMMVKHLPKIVRKLGYEKIGNPEDWTRRKGQQLRRYMQYLSWAKLEDKARAAILKENLFNPV